MGAEIVLLCLLTPSAGAALFTIAKLLTDDENFMKLTKRNDLITLSRQEVARAIGEYVQREHERLTGEACLPLVMSTEDGELNGLPVPQLKVSVLNRHTGTLRLNEVVVEVDNFAARKKAKDEAEIIQSGKEALASLKADNPGRSAAFREGVAAAEEGVNQCPYQREAGLGPDSFSVGKGPYADWQHGHLACRAVLVQLGHDFLEYRYPPSAPIPTNRKVLSDLARALIRGGHHAM